MLSLCCLSRNGFFYDFSAAVIAATENGYVEKGKDITVKLVGGDLVVNYSDHEVILTGDAVMVYEGVVEY